MVRKHWKLRDFPHEVWRQRWAYIFISPFYVLFAIFGLFPIGYSLYLSLHEWNGVRPMEYIGLENYKFVFSEKGEIFWDSVQNSVTLFLMYVPLMTFLALVLAVILNSGYVRFFRFFRTTLFMPYVTSMIAAGFVFQILLGTQNGFFNVMLESVGISKVSWLDTVRGTQVSLSMMLIWAWLGYNMVIMLAGLQTISNDLTDAARVDGASSVQAFFHITIPLMRPVILFSLVLSTIGTFNLFNEVMALAGPTGGTKRAVMTPMILIYNTGFRHFKFGRASAEAYIYFMLIAVLTFIQFRYLGEREK
ncbi:MAG: sugar ABC transporter permease [Anaerolineae bacterium]|nr:sugar ABC transporter permease [Anaerolineae bacterium]